MVAARVATDAFVRVDENSESYRNLDRAFDIVSVSYIAGWGFVVLLTVGIVMLRRPPAHVAVFICSCTCSATLGIFSVVYRGKLVSALNEIPLYCPASVFLDNLFLYGSSLVILCLILDRVFGRLRADGGPLRLNCKTVVGVVVLMWLISMMLSLPASIAAEAPGDGFRCDSRGDACKACLIADSHAGLDFVMQMLFLVVLPVVILAFCFLEVLYSGPPHKDFLLPYFGKAALFYVAVLSLNGPHALSRMVKASQRETVFPAAVDYVLLVTGSLRDLNLVLIPLFGSALSSYDFGEELSESGLALLGLLSRTVGARLGRLRTVAARAAKRVAAAARRALRATNGACEHCLAYSGAHKASFVGIDVTYDSSNLPTNALSEDDDVPLRRAMELQESGDGTAVPS